MKSQVLLCLSLIVLFVGTQAHSNHHHHASKLSHKPELLQTQSTTETEASATATDADCEPDCIYKFPYLDSECDEEKPPTTTPPVNPPKNETFIEESYSCYTFNLTPNNPPETFVVDAEGCYDFTGPSPPTTDTSSDESCDDIHTHTIYRYPFIQPGGDCPIIIDAEGSSEENVIVPTEELVIIVSGEGGETVLPPVSEEWVLVHQACYTYTVNNGGEVEVTNEEWVTFSEEIPPQVVVVISEGGEIIIVDTTSEEEETHVDIGPQEETIILSGEGIETIITTNIDGAESELLISETNIITDGDQEDGPADVTYNTDGADSELLISETIIITDGDKETTTVDSYTTSGDWDPTTPFEEEVIIINGEGEFTEFVTTYNTDGANSELLIPETNIITDGGQGTDNTVTYNTEGYSYITSEGEIVIKYGTGNEEDGPSDFTYNTSGGDSELLLSETIIITDGDNGDNSIITISHCGDSSAHLNGETIIITQYGEDSETIITITKEGGDSEPLLPETIIVTGQGHGEETIITIDTHGGTVILNEETIIITNDGDQGGETIITVNKDGGSTSTLSPEETIIIENGNGEGETTYSTSGETSIPFGEYDITIEHGEGGEPDKPCIIGDTYSTGTTIIYGQPTTYITYNHYDIHNQHSISYTYVLTNIYSGVFKTSEWEFVIYGAGAVNFYNTYYGIDARIHDTPSCSCTCGYQTYTFTYSFAF